ncbi:MAG: hypothetical protein ABIO24_06445 [Saprospiraceae bacterium]
MTGGKKGKWQNAKGNPVLCLFPVSFFLSPSSCLLNEFCIAAARKKRNIRPEAAGRPQVQADYLAAKTPVRFKTIHFGPGVSRGGPIVGNIHVLIVGIHAFQAPQVAYYQEQPSEPQQHHYGPGRHSGNRQAHFLDVGQKKRTGEGGNQYSAEDRQENPPEKGGVGGQLYGFRTAVFR